MKKLQLFTTFLLLIIISCNKSNTEIEKESNLTPKEALEIAQMHNDFLDITIPKSNGRISSDALRESFLNQEVEGLSMEDKENLLDEVVNYTQEDLKFAIDADSYLYIQKINQILLDNDILEEISGELYILMEEINQSDAQDKNVLLVYCATAIKSSEYWLPIENGGSGVGSRIIANQSSNGRVNAIESAKSIAAADALGLSSYFTGGAFFGLAAAGPAAILGGAVFAGAFGSAIAAL